MKRSCLGYPGYRCGRLVEGASRCTPCQQAVYRARNHNRPPGERQFYGSSQWKRLASAVVDVADACAICRTPKHLTRLTGGHLIPIRERPDLALDPGNVAAVCVPCQSRQKLRPDPATWEPWERGPRTSRW